MAHRPDDQLQSPETNRASSPVNDVSCPARRDREPDHHQRKSAAPPSGLPGPQPIIERFARLLVTSDGAEAERLAMVRQLRESGWTLDALEGQVVEIRGSVQERDGPSMVLRHPEQLVVLNDKRAGRDGQSSN